MLFSPVLPTVSAPRRACTCTQPTTAHSLLQMPAVPACPGRTFLPGTFLPCHQPPSEARMLSLRTSYCLLLLVDHAHAACGAPPTAYDAAPAPTHPPRAIDRAPRAYHRRAHLVLPATTLRLSYLPAAAGYLTTAHHPRAPPTPYHLPATAHGLHNVHVLADYQAPAASRPPDTVPPGTPPHNCPPSTTNPWLPPAARYQHATERTLPCSITTQLSAHRTMLRHCLLLSTRHSLGIHTSTYSGCQPHTTKWPTGAHPHTT